MARTAGLRAFGPSEQEHDTIDGTMEAGGGPVRRRTYSDLQEPSWLTDFFGKMQQMFKLRLAWSVSRKRG